MKTTALHTIQTLCQEKGSPEKAKAALRFFKTAPGDYGHGDQFLGITVPEQRKISKQFKTIPLNQVWTLLQSVWHEERLIALMILAEKYPKASREEQQSIIDGYLTYKNHVNNWDLVDSSAYKLLGEHLHTNPNQQPILNELADSKSMWDRRIAMVATLAFIRKKDFQPTLNLAEKLCQNKEDLMHKAVGWMLREMGKFGGKTELETFLDQHAATLPRTLLRYAIEHFSVEKRIHYLNRKIDKK